MKDSLQALVVASLLLMLALLPGRAAAELGIPAAAITRDLGLVIGELEQVLKRRAAKARA